MRGTKTVSVLWEQKKRGVYNREGGLNHVEYLQKTIQW